MPKPRWTIAIDPGLRYCGCSIFDGQALHCAWLAKNKVTTARGPEAWHGMAEEVFKGWLKRVPERGILVQDLVIEVPQVYWGAGRGGNAADLIEVAGVVGAVSTITLALNRAHFLPRQWKGQTRKVIHNRRVMKLLTQDEVSFIEKTPQYLLHNVVDSVGLGLFHVGRLKK